MITDEYKDFFTKQIEIISSLTSVRGSGQTSDVPLYKKISYVSLLDYFSSIRFHQSSCQKTGNRERVTNFLKECANWDVGKLVSLVFLEKKLQAKALSGGLANYVSGKTERLKTGFGDTISARDVDEKPEVLLKLATEKEEEKAIDCCVHANILYRYRNNLVHQARRAGGGSEGMGEGSDEACYHNYANRSKEEIYLIYPVGLFERLCKSSLLILTQYLKSNGIDPYKLESDSDEFPFF